MNTHPTLSWSGQLWRRLCCLWLLKAVGITVAIAAFMLVYLALQRYPQYPVSVMPQLSLDAMIPFVAWGWVPYVSLWLYIGLVPAMLYLRGEMAPYVATTVVLMVAGTLIFFFLPTDVPPSAIDWSPWPVLAGLKTADAGGNACPSLHVAYSVLTVIWMTRLLRRLGAPGFMHALNIVWCVLIVWSTLAIRQHVVLDVLAGAALGSVTTLGLWRVWPPRWQTGAARRESGPASCQVGADTSVEVAR